METKHITVAYNYCDNYINLDENIQKLIIEAQKSRENSYSPFSRFRVGVAALLDSSEMCGASNQESEVFPSGMCAERVLLYYLQSQSKAKIVKLVIVSDEDNFCYPCGACRQVLLDTERRQEQDIEIVVVGGEKAMIFSSAKSLLPFYFTLK